MKRISAGDAAGPIVQAATPALDSPQTISRYSMRFGMKHGRPLAVRQI